MVAWTEGLPTTDQYSVEANREEEYHVKQWLGQVSTEEGGQGDCYTAKGVAWMAGCIGAGPFYEYGGSPEEAKQRAITKVQMAEEDEFEISDLVTANDHGFIELKAKAYAGYNAAWKYHCMYESVFGSNPVNHRHPAY